jgi:hypothetical protein
MLNTTMKNNLPTLSKFTFIACVAAALLGAASISQAQESTNAPATTAPAPAPKKHGNVVHGKVAAVDATAMTVTVGKTTATVTSDTKITKDGKPAVFSDITVDEAVSIVYKKDDAGKIHAVSVKIGEKKKPAAAAPAAQ